MSSVSSILGLFVLAVVSYEYLAASQNLEKKGRVVCYYQYWAIYHQVYADGKGRVTLAPKDLNPYLCTHLIYDYAKIIVEGSTIESVNHETDFERNGYRDFIDLRTKYNEDLKLLLGVGGFYSLYGEIATITAKLQSRQLFARNLLNYLRKYGFDGVNIGWQYPSDRTRSENAEDYKNYPLLIKEIEGIFKNEAAGTGNPKLLLTTTVESGKIDVIEAGYDLHEVQNYVEFMNVRCFEYHWGRDEPRVYHHSPIYPLPEEVTGSGHENEGFNTDSTINFILSKGVDPEKLNLGISLYGRGFILKDEDQVLLGSPASVGLDYSGPDGYLELCNELENGYAIVRYNETALGPFAYKGNKWIGYDDEGSVRKKGEYAKKKGLGGISIWSIDKDDFIANCSTRAFPLVKAAKEGYFRAQNLLSTNRSTNAPQFSTTTPLNEIRSSSTTQGLTAPLDVIVPSLNLPASHQVHPEVLEPYTSQPSYQRETSTAEAETLIWPPISSNATSSLVRNVKIWITNNIYHHSPNINQDGSSLQSNNLSNSQSSTISPT